MATFALVHGAWHGAWCWERLAPLLQQAGHDIVALDLPIEAGTASFDAFADIVCSALDGCDGDGVAVGHSYGGMVIPLIAARRPVRHLVYVCGVIPEIGRSLADQLTDDDPYLFNPAAWEGIKLDAQSRYVWVDYELAQELMYADCDEATAKAAIKRLRPHSPYANTLPCSLSEFPSVPSTSVVCSDDRLLGREWAKQTARDIGADLIELPGSHSPFLSRPSHLADVLLRIADAN